jgi:hypothetical protein
MGSGGAAASVDACASHLVRGVFKVEHSNFESLERMLAEQSVCSAPAVASVHFRRRSRAQGGARRARWLPAHCAHRGCRRMDARGWRYPLEIKASAGGHELLVRCREHRPPVATICSRDAPCCAGAERALAGGVERWAPVRGRRRASRARVASRASATATTRSQTASDASGSAAAAFESPSPVALAVARGGRRRAVGGGRSPSLALSARRRREHVLLVCLRSDRGRARRPRAATRALRAPGDKA